MKKLFFALFVFGLCSIVNATELDSGITCIQPAIASDSTATEVYQLPNKLTIYLSPNTEEPTVTAKIVFRTGSFNDPADKTGLAHYLEHLLFKGSERLGTTDFASEKKLLDQIEALYDERSACTDTLKRLELYKQIDTLSSEAAQYGIQNEFVMALESLGAFSINAYTSYDRTVYICTIPQNQIEKWLLLELDRFQSPIFRGFHTELETVFEESNMSLDNPARRWYYFMSSKLYAGHPMDRPVIGKQEHIQNPSPRTVMKYYKDFYVPENMAICLAGDLDTATTLNAIARTFGKLPNHPVATTQRPKLAPIQGESTFEIQLPEREQLTLAWRVDSEPSSELSDLMFVTGQILSNGAAGLLDQNINLPQRAVGAAAYGYSVENISSFFMTAQPKRGESVDSIKPMLLVELEKLKNGDFPDWLLPTIVRNLKLTQSKSIVSNEWRANQMLETFVTNLPWSENINELSRIEKITKADIVAFANTYLNGNRLVLIRRHGEMTPAEKLPKIPLTPIPLVQGKQSQFYKEWDAIKVADIQPEFPNLDSDIYTAPRFAQTLAQKDSEWLKATLKNDLKFRVSAVQNKRNEFFTLQFRYPIGSYHDSSLGLAFSYINAAGTQKRSVEQLKIDLFKLAGSVGFSSNDEYTYVTISGLYETRDSLLAIAEEYLTQPRVDTEVLKNLVDNVLLSRQTSKKKPSEVMMSGLMSYGFYKRQSPFLSGMSSAELAAITPDSLIQNIQRIRKNYMPEIRYFGPFEKSAYPVGCAFKKHIPTTPKIAPEARQFTMLDTDSKRVLFVHFPNVQQVQMAFIKRGAIYNPIHEIAIEMFNAYYGQGMSSITFQTLREANSLCYSCASVYISPSSAKKNSRYFVYLTTQPSKIKQAVTAIDAMGFPCLDNRILEVRNSMLREASTARFRDWALISHQDYVERMNVSKNIERDRWEQLKAFTPVDLQSFYDTHVGGRPPMLLILGDRKDLDMDYLKTLGTLEEIAIDELFPY